MWFRKVSVLLPSEKNSNHSKLTPFSTSLRIILWCIEAGLWYGGNCAFSNQGWKAHETNPQYPQGRIIFYSLSGETSWNKSQLCNFMYCQMSKMLFQNDFSILKHLHDFLTEKPGKPYFRKREKSDAIECISESYPQPSVEWIFCKTPEKRYSLCLYACWISRLKVYHLLKKKGEALYCLVCLVSCEITE